MMSGIELLIALIAVIALMVRWRLIHRLVPAFLRQRIHSELHGRLDVSAQHLQSTFDGVSLDSGSSTSR